MNRRILILPDGNGRIATNLEGYAAGADNVVACAEYLAQRGDIETLVMCIVSDLNAQKRSDSFFLAVAAQFSRLRTNIVTKGHLIRRDIRCYVLGNLEEMRSMGGARAMLAEEANAVAEATHSVSRPAMNVEFWFAYSSEIAWQSDVDLIVRTGAEDPDVVRPGMSLPPNVRCVVTTTLWPEVKPAQIGEAIDYNLRDHAPRFAPGYALDLVEHLLRVFPASRVPAPVRLTIPLRAPESDILALLKRMHANPHDGPAVTTTYAASSGNYEFGPQDDVWYRLHLVPAAHWNEKSSEPYDAILTPGQHTGSVMLAMPSARAHVHSCVATADDVLAALGRAVRFPIKHVLLQGADRSKSSALQSHAPWDADLVDFMHELTQSPQTTVENFVRERLPVDVDGASEKEWLIRSISAKVLGQALAQGLLLPDELVRRSDLNYAYTGAYMMLRIPDEGNPTGLSWEKAAEMAIRCMLTISTGDNGVFDRMYPGETPREWRNRLETSAEYLMAIAQTDAAIPCPATRDARLLRAIGMQWQAMLDPHADTSPDLFHACRDALRRHYLANMNERSPDVVDNPLVHWLCLGGLPRREAMREIEKRYAQTTPFPMAEKIRELLTMDVTKEKCFQAVRREMKLLLHLADTAHSIAVEVLFLFCALTTPKETLTPEKLQALVAVGQLADYMFRLANDFASLNDTLGGDQDSTKESCLSILIPKVSSASEREVNIRMARELGGTILSWLEEHLEKAVRQLHTLWPSMATKVMRAIRVGRGVYAEAHYTTLSTAKMMTLLRRLDGETRPGEAMQDQPPRQTMTASPASGSQKNLQSMYSRR